MQKLIKNPIFTFILGIAISCSVGAVLAYTLSATEVEFHPMDNNWDTNDVDDALNDLYKKLDYCNPVHVALTGAKVSSGTTINVKVGDLIVITSFGSMSATNAEVLVEHLWGDTYAGIGSRTSLYRATGTSVRLTCDRQLAYIVLRE